MSAAASLRHIPGMDGVRTGRYGGRVTIGPRAHLWRYADLWGVWVSYCAIHMRTRPEPITDPTATRCTVCATCPTEMRK